MRQIKFRAWDKTHNCWTDHNITIGLDGWVCDHTIDDGRDDIELMQYTGLKDKNGKEIYESDVIHCIGDTFPAVVVFDEKALCWSAQLYHRGIKNELMTLGRYIYSRERAVRSKIEVIGNIYENPELLEADK